VVEQTDIQKLSSLHKGPRHGHIIRAGCWIIGRVIMNTNYRWRHALDGGFEYFRHAHLGAVDVPVVHLNNRHHPVTGVQ
jgi:hypothetical protein